MQLLVLSTAAGRLGQHLPIRPWEDVWAHASALPVGDGDQLVLHMCSPQVGVCRSPAIGPHAPGMQEQRPRGRRDAAARLQGLWCVDPVRKRQQATGSRRRGVES